LKKIEVHISDLQKIADVLDTACVHHEARDASNAALHMSQIRHSPLTSALLAERDRVNALIDQAE
jgi:hypothetical protein